MKWLLKVVWQHRVADMQFAHTTRKQLSSRPMHTVSIFLRPMLNQFNHRHTLRRCSEMAVPWSSKRSKLELSSVIDGTKKSNGKLSRVARVGEGMRTDEDYTSRGWGGTKLLASNAKPRQPTAHSEEVLGYGNAMIQLTFEVGPSSRQRLHQQNQRQTLERCASWWSNANRCGVHTRW